MHCSLKNGDGNGTDQLVIPINIFLKWESDKSMLNKTQIMRHLGPGSPAGVLPSLLRNNGPPESPWQVICRFASYEDFAQRWTLKLSSIEYLRHEKLKERRSFYSWNTFITITTHSYSFTARSCICDAPIARLNFQHLPPIHPVHPLRIIFQAEIFMGPHISVMKDFRCFGIFFRGAQTIYN